jgi:hypothetical protein
MCDFEIPMAGVVRSFILWDETPKSLVRINWRFGETYSLQTKIAACCLYDAGFLLDLLVEPEYRGDIFIRNIDWRSPDYAPLQLKKQNSSKECGIMEEDSVYLRVI